MPDYELICGPPGTGKTTALTAAFERCLDAGVEPEEIQVATFTRAARAEIKGRILESRGWGQDRIPWVRTIHSAANMILAVPKESHFRQAVHGRQFAAKYGYLFSSFWAPAADEADDAALFLGGATIATEDDRLRAAYDWGRARMMPAEAIPGAYPADEPLDEPAFASYVTRYEAFKVERGLVDYADLLSSALTACREHGSRPPVRVVIADEAQDLTAVQVALLMAWAGPAERLIVAGDDDQVIFGWAGASPDWMIEFASRATVTVLPQSYRVPRRVQVAAGCVIRRNARRLTKRWKARPEEGSIARMPMDKAVGLAADVVRGEGTAFLLFRNRMFAEPACEHMIESGVPFIVESRGSASSSPLGLTARSSAHGETRFVDAVRVASQLARSESVDGEALAAAVAHFVRADGLLPRGVKASLEGLAGSFTVFDCETLGLGAWVAKIRELGPVRCFDLGVSATDIEYVAGVCARNGGLLPEKYVVVSTIHGAKGREADFVAVSPDMTMATYKAYLADEEPENRVFYVAMTRARKSLVMCDPETDRHFEWPNQEETGERRVREGALSATEAIPNERRSK
mgnify:FL=1